MASNVSDECKNMALPRILIIDDNKTRAYQLETVVQFMGYAVETVGSTEYVPCFREIGQLSGVLVGDGIDKQATVIGDIVERADKVPVILVINKGTALQVSTIIAMYMFDHLQRGLRRHVGFIRPDSSYVCGTVLYSAWCIQ